MSRTLALALLIALLAALAWRVAPSVAERAQPGPEVAPRAREPALEELASAELAAPSDAARVALPAEPSAPPPAPARRPDEPGALPARAEMVVRLLGAGERVEVARDDALRDLPDAWPAVPTVFAFACASGAEPGASGGALDGHVGAGEARFEVASGRRYLVGALGPGFDGAPRVVDVPAGAPRVELELRAAPRAELGELSVRARRAGGRELVGGRMGELFDVRLESERGGVPLLVRRARGPAPWVLRAPPGRYRVALEGAPSVDRMHGHVYGPRALGRAEAEVEIAAGITTEVELELDGGARLELTLVGEPDESDRAAVLAGADGWRAALDADDAEREARLARVELVRASGAAEDLVRRTPSSPISEELTRRWRLGETRTSEIVPTGRHAVVARLPGGREARAEVELAEGETRALVLRFEARR